MALGYDGKLYILAFDHRGSFQKKMFDIEGDPTPEETKVISDAKKLIYEGMEKAVQQGLDASSAGVLVDEQFGSDIPELAAKEGLSLTMPAEPAQLESVGGDTDRYDAELRPELMRRAIEEIQAFGIEVDIWKIEGVDERSDCEMLAAQTRSGEGRENVVCVVLGRGASIDKVDQWLRAGAPVDGYVGFAIGRSIWWDALKAFLDGSLAREQAAEQIAGHYLRFIQVYEEATAKVA